MQFCMLESWEAKEALRGEQAIAPQPLLHLGSDSQSSALLEGSACRKRVTDIELAHACSAKAVTATGVARTAACLTVPISAQGGEYCCTSAVFNGFNQLNLPFLCFVSLIFSRILFFCICAG